MSAFPVWADGRLHPPGTPVISAEDQGFLLGLSVFDSLVFQDECFYFAEAHLERLRDGARELDIPWPPPFDPADALWEYVDAIARRDCVTRITLTRGVPGAGPTMAITGRAIVVPPPPGVSVHVSGVRKLGGDELEGVKSTNRLRNVKAREEAQAHGAWEALVLNHEGDVSEGTISNLFVVREGRLLTPSTARGCLAGIVRDQILAELEREPLGGEDGRAVPLVVDRVEVVDLERASEAFLTNSSGRVLPITAIGGLPDGRRTLPGDAGAVTGAVRQRVRALEAAYRTAHPPRPRDPGRG